MDLLVWFLFAQTAAAAHAEMAAFRHFPPAKVCEIQHKLAQDYCTELDNVIQIWTGDGIGGGWQGGQLRQARCEAEKLREFWWAAWWVACPKTSFGDRQHWAERCRDMIGPERYVRGEWPPALPAWRFAEN